MFERGGDYDIALTGRLQTLVNMTESRLLALPSHHDRETQYLLQMVVDELKRIIRPIS